MPNQRRQGESHTPTGAGRTGCKGRDKRLGFGGFRESHINKTEWKNFIAGTAKVFSTVPNGEVPT